jgi:hypothetical protein
MLRAMASDATSFFENAQRRAAGWLAARDGHGIHRTATTGDDAGADWLAREAAALGAAVAIEEFALDRLDPVAAFLRLTASGSTRCRCSTRRRPMRRALRTGSGRSAAMPSSLSPSCRPAGDHPHRHRRSADRDGADAWMIAPVHDPH